MQSASTSISERMACPQELGEFKGGTMNATCAVSSVMTYRTNTFNYVKKKKKVAGSIRNSTTK